MIAVIIIPNFQLPHCACCQIEWDNVEKTHQFKSGWKCLCCMPHLRILRGNPNRKFQFRNEAKVVKRNSYAVGQKGAYRLWSALWMVVFFFFFILLDFLQFTSKRHRGKKLQTRWVMGGITSQKGSDFLGLKIYFLLTHFYKVTWPLKWNHTHTRNACAVLLIIWIFSTRTRWKMVGEGI